MSPKSLALFFRQLHALLSAGVSVPVALDSLAAQAPHRGLRAAVRTAAAAHGAPLSERFRSSRAFPPLALGLIEAGETSGHLDRVLEMLAAHYEEVAEDRRTLLAALAYPAFLAAFGVAYVLVAPILVGALGGSFELLGTPGGNALRLSIVAVSAAALYGIYRGLIRFPSFARAWEHFLRASPVVGGILRRRTESRFCWSLAMMVEAGVDLATGLERAGAASGSPLLEAWSVRAAGRLRGGERLSPMMADSDLLYPATVRMVEVGETTGSLDETLRRVARLLHDEARSRIRIGTIALSVGAFLPVAVFVALFVIRFWTGYFRGIAGG